MFQAGKIGPKCLNCGNMHKVVSIPGRIAKWYYCLVCMGKVFKVARG